MIIVEGLPISEVIHFRSSFSATATVVPDHQKKSATSHHGGQEAFMIRSRSFSGF
jgi:hypothetical protein